MRAAQIVSTSQSSFWRNNHSLYPVSNLINDKGHSGRFKGYNCARTNYGPTEWFTFELKVPQTLFSIKITPRLDCCPERSQNIGVTIGSSRSYNPKEPLCLPVIPQLALEEGLTEYKCTGELHQGRFVKITRHADGNDGIMGMMDICEIKIFTVGGNHTLIGGIIQSYYLWHSHRVYK